MARGGLVMVLTASSALERSGVNSKDSNAFYLKTRTRIWPRLSGFSRIGSTAAASLSWEEAHVEAREGAERGRQAPRRRLLERFEFRVQGLGLRVDLGFRVWGLGSRV